MNKKFLLTLVLSIFVASTLYATNVSSSDCVKQGDDFIFAGGECIQFYEAEGDKEKEISIIVHGTWKEGTNTLARYSPFADDLSMQTDITSIAVSLPGYSKSSSNKLKSLSHEGEENLAATKEYIFFLADLVQSLKDKYEAATVNYIGHSAGAMMGATLLGIKPNLVNNIILAGGKYNIDEGNTRKNLISITDVLDKVSKDTNILLVYGSKDKISKPKVTKDFYKLAKSKNLKVKILEAKDAVHLDLDMTDTSVEGIVELLDK
jgi:predicted esterase